MGVLAGLSTRAGGRTGRLQRPHLPALAGALLIQLLLLGPVAWSGLSGTDALQQIIETPDDWVLPLDLTPPAPVSAPAARAPFPDARPIRLSPPTTIQTAPIRNDAPPQAVPSQAAVDPRWRVAAPVAGKRPAAPGPEVCRDISNIRAWMAANCREHGPPPRAELRGSPPAEIARPEPRRGRAPGATAADTFAAQAAANEAWRDYTRGDGAYPGLRSLAKHH
jgi:hypothetical protein